ncbi:hypothetical protein [Novacetimonas pomaceti]|uniref:Uncharacterized protein n=1 Tax=Novacetimonas pomaceti TaxID=2021998 RepID=A0ABX5P032_9PROT|nr:hypothetical protein [Novacetimonas pomaceti]PYD47125.1 hypothetical protein C3920_11625 [Novacetimonas pomaceti]
MKQPVKCDPELLQFLGKIQNKHIDYLVDVLTDNGRGRLALSSSIKDLLLTEKAEQDYSEEGLCHLLHELQEYGGNSLVNRFRSAPVPYSELLTDVHRQLNGLDSHKKTNYEKEQEIVLSLFGKEWQSLEDHERWERCTETKVITGFFNMQEKLDVNKNFRINIRSGATRATAFLGLSVSPPMIPITATVFSLGEAYRITIPFVAHIAMLKMLYPSEAGQ